MGVPNSLLNSPDPVGKRCLVYFSSETNKPDTLFPAPQLSGHRTQHLDVLRHVIAGRMR